MPSTRTCTGHKGVATEKTMKRIGFVAAMMAALIAAAVSFTGCGSSDSLVTNTPGWQVQIYRWAAVDLTPDGGAVATYGWVEVEPTGPLCVGDTVDLVLEQVSRGGQDWSRSVTLPDGTVLGDEAFGKGGYTLTMTGVYTFNVHATTAGGSPRASCTRTVTEGLG